MPIYFDGIESGIEKLPKIRQRFIELGLLRRGHARIGHHPVGHEVAQKKPLRETDRLRPCKKQFLRLLNFLLPLRFDVVHRCTKVEIERNASCIPGSFRIQCRPRKHRPGSPCRCRNASRRCP